jgi:hypothetical protein
MSAARTERIMARLKPGASMCVSESGGPRDGVTDGADVGVQRQWRLCAQPVCAHDARERAF